MKEKTKLYVVEWQEVVTYSEEVEAENKDQALILSGAEGEIVDASVVEDSIHIEEVQQ